MQKSSYFWINGITYYRLFAAPILLLLIILHDKEPFKWLLTLSFFTDAIDGLLARKYRVTSAAGSRLDSIADDLTVLMAVIGLWAWNKAFILSEWKWVLLLLILFLLQVGLALLKYRRMTSFHTYLAKVAAVLQALFLILSFFLPSPPHMLFYIAMGATALDLLEETIMVVLLPKWRTDVKGIWEAIKYKKLSTHHI